MKYDVTVLKGMLATCEFNINAFKSYRPSDYTRAQLASLEANRKDLIAIIANNGVPVDGCSIDPIAYTVNSGHPSTANITYGT